MKPLHLLKNLVLLIFAKYEQHQKHKGPQKLQARLFKAYLLVAIIVLISFSFFFYEYVSSILIANEESALSALNASILEQVDSVINDLDITSANINYSSLMSDNLDSSFNLEITETNLPHLADLFVTINGSDIKADQINLFDLKGNEVKVGMITSTARVDLKELDWFETVKELNGLKLISAPYHTDAYAQSSASSDWFISVYRTYSNQYGRKVGVIETVKRCKNLFKSAVSYEKKNKESAAIYIYSETGALVYPYSIPDSDKEVLTYYYDQIPDLLEKSLIRNPFTNEREHLAFAKSAYSKWTYVTVQKESIILRPVANLSMILFGVIIAILGIAIMISYYVSRNLTRPVMQLKKIIQDMDLDTLGQGREETYHPYYIELDELYHDFEAMSKKLKISLNELIDSRQQELKSRTLALQSQTNPHFYYNTLSCIIVLAENRKNDEVVTLCKNLTQIMRYITDHSSQSVTLKEEMEYVEKYLYCMKVRYQSSLNCILEIDPQLLDLSVPKLIIQPLVENAIKYGTDCLPPWTITVTGKLYDDRWQIDVIDSGNGFTTEAIQMIHERIALADANPGMPELKIDGLGIVNVYMRWRIYCREHTIFEVGNTPDGHGMVSIGCKCALKNKNL
ncbi:MAG: histidine kinase [Lachnospiraceae bacterium]|nr:histidine kinase [Lachnospiraceae bacterium]MDD3660239.1 histidine kinase [Lachnospiraceae bacterium]